jgi:hypothetical protein
MNSSGATSGGKKPVGKLQAAIAELYWLWLVDADHRVLVLTNREFFAFLQSELHGSFADGLAVEHRPLRSSTPPTGPNPSQATASGRPPS